MAYNWNNKIASKDDLSINNSSFNQQNYGMNSTNRLNAAGGYRTGWNSNTGVENGRGNNVQVPSEQERIDCVYKNGTYGINNFIKTSFEEYNVGKLEKFLFATISASENFQGFTQEELRYIDYRLKKRNLNTNKQYDTPQFNKVGVNNIATNVIGGNKTNITGGFGNFSVNKSNMGLNNNPNSNLHANYNNNDLNPYLRPSSTSLNPHPNTGISNINSNLNNSFSGTSNINKLNGNNYGTGSVRFNSQLGQTALNAFNKNAFPTNNNNFGGNAGSNNPAIGNPNKSLANYFDTSARSLPVNNNNITNNNPVNRPSNPIGISNTTGSNVVPLASISTPTSFNNNNFINSTTNNFNFANTRSGTFTPENNFNPAFSNQNHLVHNSYTIPPNNLNNNNIHSSLPFVTNSNLPSHNLNQGLNYNFSTPSQNTIHLAVNQDNLNRPQNVQYGMTSNTFPNYHSHMSNNFMSNPVTGMGIGNNPYNPNNANSSALTFKSNLTNGNNITFNNPNAVNTTINQMKSLNAINEVLTRFNNNDDYLGIRSMCQEVNNNLNSNLNFSKKELEEILDFSSLDNNTKNYNKYSSNLNGAQLNKRSLFNTSGKTNFDIKQQKEITALKDRNSYKSFSLNTQQKLLTDKNNKENYNNHVRGGLLSTINKPLDKLSNIADFHVDMKERSSSRDSEFKFNPSNVYREPYKSLKKTISIKDILPMNNIKPITDNNLVEKVDDLEEKNNNEINMLKTFKKSQTESKLNDHNMKLNYYNTHEFLQEIEKMAEEAHLKSVGPITNTESDNIYTANKNFAGLNNQSTNNKIFSKNKNYFHNTDTKFLKRTPHIAVNALNTLYKPKPINMNTIYETKEETDGQLYDINAINPLDFLEISNNKKKSNEYSDHNLLPIDCIDDGILNLKFKIFSPINYEFNIKINKKNKVIDLRRAIEELLKEKYPHDFQISSTDSIVIFTKNGVLKDEDIIETKSFVNEYEVINIFTVDDSNIHELDTDSKFSNKENFNSTNANELIRELDNVDVSSIKSEFEGFLNDPILNEKNRDAYGDFNENVKTNLRNHNGSNNNKNFTTRPEYCPVTNKYKTEPPYYELIQMAKENLENLKNFCVSNEHGKILFKNVTDVTYLNLDEIVNISPLYVDVYQHVKPPMVGKKLNKEARIFIYNLEIPNEAKNSDEEYFDFIIKIKNNLSEQNAQLVHYDQDKSELIFDVKSFESKNVDS